MLFLYGTHRSPLQSVHTFTHDTASCSQPSTHVHGHSAGPLVETIFGVLVMLLASGVELRCEAPSANNSSAARITPTSATPAKIISRRVGIPRLLVALICDPSLRMVGASR